jgi:hypothetical protein
VLDNDAGEFVAYLELDDALELYAAIIGATVAQAEDHLRNQPGLESALARSEISPRRKHAIPPPSPAGVAVF